MNGSWSKDSWRKFPIAQQPDWPDVFEYNKTIHELAKLPSLVFSGETRKLTEQLEAVNQGNAFVLQVGHCSESFEDCNGPRIHNFLRIILQMSIVLMHGTGKRIIKIGRIAGQYAKPRSSKHDEIDGHLLPVYRGDIVNRFEPNLSARTPEAGNLLEGYFRSAATLNLLRAFTQGGYSDLKNLKDWKQHFFSQTISDNDNYTKFEKSVSSSLREQEILNLDTPEIIYVSHEALILDYEEAFVRVDTTTGGSYSTSAHTLWIGNRTRQPRGAHVEFVRGIGNPIGVKVSHDASPAEINEILEKINPGDKPGRVMLICRFGNRDINAKLPTFIAQIKQKSVIWLCDPMHGNTFTHNGYKVRSMNDIIAELQAFFRICRQVGITAGGIHLEITGEYVSECIGGIEGLTLKDVPKYYVTKVDPRLNAAQALELSFLVAEGLANSYSSK